MNKELKTLKRAEIVPYDNNPRKNDEAVAAVAESIRQCGYVSPIIVDEENVILAGHTRYRAMSDRDEIEVMQVTGLTEDEKKKFRLLDNKTNEFAGWDFELLDMELEGLDFEDFDFGFGADDIDFDETELDAENEKTNVVASLNFGNVNDYYEVKERLSNIADEVGATLAVKMA